MGIRFEKERYEALGEIYEKWWEGDLGRPLVKVMVREAYEPEREKPKVPLLSQANCAQLSYSPEELIDRIDYELSRCAFWGDAFPMVNFWSFGPGALAGFCGAELCSESGNVWYRTEKKKISDIHIHYNPQNIWAMRIKELYQAGLERWQGQVVMGMPDLGGVQDVVANFVGNEEMLFALYDNKEQLHRLQEEVYQAWMEAYEDFTKILAEGNPGFTDWGGLYSKSPSYILQDDFAYMISPEMYREFAYPEIEKACRSFSHTIYHLDGPGNLNHLPLLLKNPDLKAIQWVYGEGQPSAKHWTEVYEKIYRSHKGIEVIGSLEDFQALYKKYGDRLYYQCTIDDQDKTAFGKMMEKDCIHSYQVFPKEEKDNIRNLLEILKIPF